MKTKTLLIGLALLMAGKAFPQSRDLSFDLIPFHYPSDNNCEPLNLIQQHDGNLLTKMRIFTPSPNSAILGTLFYKVSPTTAEITDTLFLPGEEYEQHFYLFDKDPNGEGIIRANAELDGDYVLNLRISRFIGGGFPVDPSEEVVVPLCDSISSNSAFLRDSVFECNTNIIDCRGDLIWKYYKLLPNSIYTTYECHIARYGLDGTLKHETVLLPSFQHIPTHFGVFSEHPLKYYQWDGSDNLILYVYDSLFRQENYYAINKGFLQGHDPLEVYFEFSNNSVLAHTYVIPDGNDVLVAAPYYDFSNGFYYDSLELGTAVARYELRTMQQKGLVMFNDYSGPDNIIMTLGFFKSSSGHPYFLYKENAWNDDGQELSTPITAVKMTPDLNILWKRYIEMPKDFNVTRATHFVMSEDEDAVKITVFGNSRHKEATGNKHGIFYFFLTDDDPLGADEGEIKIRPYAFWPNPVQGRLSLKYSPDMQPQAIELYDLQGRLVRSQTMSLESLSMEGLAAGQYVMKVTMEDGKVFTDKVVKE